MDDADAGRNHREGLERLLAPLEEFVALTVADELDLHVAVERLLAAGEIHLDGVVDHQIDRHQRLDHLRIGALRDGGVTHRGHIDQQRNSGEILQDDAGDGERDLIIAGGLGIPVRRDSGHRLQ